MLTSFNETYTQLARAIVDCDLKGRKRLDDKCIAQATRSEYTGPKSRFLPLDMRKMINSHLEDFEKRGILKLRVKPSASTLIYTADILKGVPLNKLYGEVGMISSRDVQLYVSGSLKAALNASDIRNVALKKYAEKCIVNAPIGGKGTLFTSGDRRSCMQENFAAIRAFKGADEVLELKEPKLVRHVSVSAYGNSKAFNEPLLYRKINAILSETAPEDIRTRHMLERDSGMHPSWCESFGVMKNPYSEVFEGCFDVTVGGDALRIRDVPFSFWSDHAECYERITTNADTIITIENETTYTDYNASGVIKCYTGGFPSHFLIKLLGNIEENNPGIRWLHWSDIDPYGFEIFSFLKDHVTKKYEPYHMDAQTYYEHIEAALPSERWTENDSVLNDKYLSDPYFSEVAHILNKTHRKLEQEAISLHFEGGSSGRLQKGKHCCLPADKRTRG